MAEYPTLPLWTDAYLGDTTHLNDAEHGSYLLLLITAWRTETTDLPDDDVLLARYARCTPRAWPHRRRVLAPFFRISGGRWVQLRLLDEKRAVVERRALAAANGRLSALKRKERHSADRPTERPAERYAQRQQSVNETPTPPSPSLNPSPSTVEEEGSVADATGAEAPITDPLKVMFDSGVALLGSAGIATARARPILGKWRQAHGPEAVIVALGKAQREGAIDPISFIEGCLKNDRPHRPTRPAANGSGTRPSPAWELYQEGLREEAEERATEDQDPDRGTRLALPPSEQR